MEVQKKNVAAEEEEEEAEGGSAVLVTSSGPTWDPMTSSDWDNETPSNEAIVRIKG